MLNGYGIADLAPDFLIICGIIIFCQLLAIIKVKNKINA